MFANIRQEYPAKRIFRLRRGYGGQVRLRIGQTHRSRNLVSFLSILLEKHDMSPCRRAEEAGGVVGISRQRESIVRHLVQFFARDLASLAPYANPRFGQEPTLDVILNEGMSALIGPLNSFADHIAPIYPGTRARDQPPL